MEVVISSPKRTPIGKFQGGLSTVRPDDLLAENIRHVIEINALDPQVFEDVYMGCANQAGEDNRNIARMASVLAGLPYSVPGVTVNRLCASGLEAVCQAYRSVKCGDGDIFIAGGVESMSRAPYSMPRGPQMPKAGNVTIYDTSLGWRYPNPKMKKIFPLEAMGCTAENIVDRMKITREDQDLFAYNSHQKALQATANGFFEDEIMHVIVPKGKRDTTTITKDEGPRADTSLERLAKLKPAFRKENGTVTAGNSSTLNDGSAAMIVSSLSKAKELGLQPMAKIISCASAGVDPEVMGLGPIPATKKALFRAGIGIADLDLIELNEAFAAQSLGVIRQLGLSEAKVNVHGGAIALGHPLGCSGARILTTLLYALRRKNGRYGLATLCVGVGQGVSMVVENLQ